MPAWRLRRHALRRDALAQVRAAVLGSPLVGASTLAGSFQASRGFGVVFTSEGVETFRARFPFLVPFWRIAREPAPERQLIPLPMRWWRAPPPPNAFFLNLLSLGPGAEVGRHVDATLAKPSGEPDATPLLVSVLYLSVPDGGRGGRLMLDEERSARAVGALVPREGTLIHFRGDLAHRVEAFSAPSPTALRASLVLEQYRLPDAALARLPAFQIQSRAGFPAYLEDHRRRASGGLAPTTQGAFILEP